MFHDGTGAKTLVDTFHEPGLKCLTSAIMLSFRASHNRLLAYKSSRNLTISYTCRLVD